MDEEHENKSVPVLVPHRELSADALAGVIEEYVTRDGTEPGDAVDKSQTVLRLLEEGELLLVFDPDSESCNIIPNRNCR